MRKANVAIVGCGNISSIYLENLTGRFRNVEVTAVCDMVEEKAKAQAEKYGVPRVLSFEQILADPDIDIVLYEHIRRAEEFRMKINNPSGESSRTNGDFSERVFRFR